MKRMSIFIMSILLLVIGVTLGYYLGTSVRHPKYFNWKELTIDPSGKGYGNTIEFLFTSADIALPDIKKLSGKTKFLSLVKIDRHELNLGYIVSVDVENLNFEKVPEKYTEDPRKKHKAGEIRFMPIEEVVYQVNFMFTLKDRDGFELIKLEGPKHLIYSGKDNRFQDIVVNQTILKIVAEGTKDIVLYMKIRKCVTCF